MSVLVVVVALALASALVVWGVGLLVGLALFPRGEVTLLSGTTVSLGEALAPATRVMKVRTSGTNRPMTSALLPCLSKKARDWSR